MVNPLQQKQKFNVVEEIEAYTKSVRNGSLICDISACPRCGTEGVRFRRHDQRRRLVFVPVGRLVKKIVTWLSRWKCSHCGRTFTLYPCFILPYKRYLYGAVLTWSRNYLRDPATSYRKGVRENGLPIHYESSEADKIDDRTLAHSTLYKWLTAFSKMTRLLHELLNLIRQASANAAVFRNFSPICPTKYRTERRRKQLQTCLRLFLAEESYSRIFQTSFFPHFETGGALK